MKVLLVSATYYPIIGGSETLTEALSVKLNELGTQTDILTVNMDTKWNPRWREETKCYGKIRVFRMPGRAPFPGLSSFSRNLLRINVFPKPNFVKKFEDYDIIHFVGEDDLSLPLLSRFVKKPKLLHCVTIFGNGGIYKYYLIDRPFLKPLFKRYFPSLADTFVCSSVEEKELLSDMGVSRNRTLVLPLGVDVNLFRVDLEKKIDNLVLFVGRIDRIKGLHVLIEALSYIKIPLQLAIIGPRYDEEYTLEMEEKARAINEKGVHKITFLGGLNQSSLITWYQKASILVCPYLYETHSNVVREALACGTPVISTGTHLTECNSDGILLTSKNPKDLANALIKLSEDKELREKYGREGRKIIEQCFSWDSIVKDLITSYEHMKN